MKQEQLNEAARTWRLASYEPPTERRVKKKDRREDNRRGIIGDRRSSSRRSLSSLFRL